MTNLGSALVLHISQLDFFFGGGDVLIAIFVFKTTFFSLLKYDITNKNLGSALVLQAAKSLLRYTILYIELCLMCSEGVGS